MHGRRWLADRMPRGYPVLTVGLFSGWEKTRVFIFMDRKNPDFYFHSQKKPGFYFQGEKKPGFLFSWSEKNRVFICRVRKNPGFISGSEKPGFLFSGSEKTRVLFQGQKKPGFQGFLSRQVSRKKNGFWGSNLWRSEECVTPACGATQCGLAIKIQKQLKDKLNLGLD